MKKVVLFFFISIIILSAVITVCADSEPREDQTDIPENPVVSNEMIDILTANRENLFPITSHKDNFTTVVKPVYSDVGAETVVRTETESGKEQIRLFVNADSVHDYTAFDRVISEFPSNFQLTVDVTVNDIFPRTEGGCFIGFADDGFNSLYGSADAQLVAVLINKQNAELYTKINRDDAGTHTLIGNVTRNPLKLTIIHLIGHTYVYLNDVYAGQYHDGKDNAFQLVYGAAVYPDGDSANCSFDNLVVRKVVGK